MIFRFNKIKFSITNDCECNCKFCYRGINDSKYFLSIDTIKKCIEESIDVGFNKIQISGGNPMLHPDFDDLMGYVLSLNNKIKLSTNPTFLEKSKLKMFHAKGLNEIAFSLNSPYPEINDRIRGLNGDFHNALKIIKFFLNTDLKIILTYVVTRQNINDIIKFNEIFNIGENTFVKLQLIEKSLMPSCSSLSDYLLNINEFKLLYLDIIPELLRKYDDTKIYFIPKYIPDKLNDAQLINFSKGIFAPLINCKCKCDYMLYNPHIKEDGSVYPCCGKTKDRVIGNIYKDSIYNIYLRHIKKLSGNAILPYLSCKYCVFYSYYNT